MAKIENAVIGVMMYKEDCVYLFPKEEYSHKIDYYIIASLKQAKKLKVGDTIEYEPCGMSNFGLFVSKVRSSKMRKKSLS